MAGIADKTVVSILVVALTVGAIGCDRDESPTSDDQIDVVVTTTMLEDTVEQLGGDDFEAHSLVNIGADPHVYQPQPADARLVAESDAVVKNGLLLEGWMESLLENAGGERPIIVGGDAIDEEELIRVEGAVDPHVWFDVQMWRQVTEEVAEGMIEVAGDDEIEQQVRDRHDAYDQQLAELDDWIEQRLASIPDEQRVLITSHDAFNYFGQAYDIEVAAVQGLSTEQEPSQRDVANVIDLVEEHNAPAVFTETSVNPSLIEQVANETGAERAGPLYSDSVGPAEENADSYVGMVQGNVEMITEALGGEYETFADVDELAGDGA